MSYPTFAPTQPWAATWQGVTPSLNAFEPMIGGIAGLPGSAGGVLARGLGSVPGVTGSIPSLGGGLAAQVPNGVGASALTDALALGGGGGGGGAAGLGRFLPSLELGGANLSKAGLMKGAGYGFLGQIGSGIADKYTPGSHNSNLEQGLQGAAQGAGLGAGVGSIFPGIGTGVGAIVGGVGGAAIGVLSNIFGGHDDKEDDPMVAGEKILATAITKAGIPDSVAAEILDTYETNLALAEQFKGKDKEAYQQQALQAAGQMVLQQIGQAQQGGMAAGAGGTGNMLALQAQAQQIFQPLADSMQLSSKMYGDSMAKLIPTLPAESRPYAQMQAATEMKNSSQLANAYMAQAQIQPAVQQLTQYQQDYNNYAAQQFSQALAQQAAAQAGGGAGGGTTDDLLARLQGAA